MTHRILQIIPTLGRSGTEKQFVLLAQGLAGRGFDVHACALTGGGPLAEELRQTGVPLTVIGQALKFDPAAYWRLKKHIAALRPELVQTWMFTANAYGRTAALAAGVKRVIASQRDRREDKPWHCGAIDRYLGKRSAAIVVNSRGVQEFQAEQGLPADKLRLIHNGIAPAEPSSITREELLSELGLPAQVRLIGSVARLTRDKRIKDLIWAADLIKVLRDDVHLLVIGDGPDRALLERFRRLCHVDEKVHFLGVRGDVPRIMPHFDVFWLASESEGLPHAIMEAMACGVPVVASDIWGNRELVVHGETGFLVPLGDRAGLARQTYKILEDRELATRLGLAGRERMRSQFTVEAMVEKHAALYREILA